MNNLPRALLIARKMQQLRKEFQQAKSILQLMLEREQLNDVISQNLQLYV